MTPADLQLLKRHCRIDDYSDAVEDSYLEHLYSAAVAILLAETNRSESDVQAEGDYPTDFKHAAFMVAAHLHDNPESTSPASYVTDPYVSAVIKKYEKLSDRTEE